MTPAQDRDHEWMPARMTNQRAVFRFASPSSGEQLDWTVEGKDNIRAFEQLLNGDGIHYYTRDLWFGLEALPSCEDYLA